MTDVKNFKAKDILECGQIFRFTKNDDGHYTVFSTDKRADVYENDGSAEIVTDNVEYFCNFFDLDRDYSVFQNKYKSYVFLIKDYIHINGIII